MKEAKVILVDPPWHRLFGSHYNGIPLGICYVSSYLREHGVKSKVFNADFVDSSEYLNQVQRFHQYERYLGTLQDLNHPIWRQIVNDVLKENPDIVGFSVNQVSLRSALNLVKLLKVERKELKIVFGGPQATVAPKKWLGVNCVVHGEGEKSMLEFVKNPTLTSIQKPLVNNLDDLPFPDRDSIRYNGATLEYGHLISGRGCPYNCIFCASRKIWGRVVRFRSVDNIISEMDEVNELYKTKNFYFRDDTFTLNSKRVEAICNKLKKRGYRWQCDTRVDTLNKRILGYMKDAGCHHIKVGVESGNERILKLTNKHITKNQVREAVKWAKHYGIEVTTYFMIGFPTETDKELKDSLLFAKELDPDYVSLSVVTPYRGTELGEMMKLNIEDYEKYFHQSPELLKQTGLSQSLVEEFYELVRR